MKSGNLGRGQGHSILQFHPNGKQFLSLLFLVCLYHLIFMPRNQASVRSTNAHQQSKQHHVSDAFDTLRQITVTNYGWFHPDPQVGINVPRCLAMKDFTEAVIAHDRFNASAWHDLELQPDPKSPIIAFLDIDTCRLRHWPKFHGHFALSSDREGGRQPMTTWDLGTFRKDCTIIKRALRSPALSAPDSRLVVLSCYTDDKKNIPCLRADRNTSGIFSKLVVGHMSAHKNHTHPHDFGLPPWPVKSVSLNSSQFTDIQTCRNTFRDKLFSFHGRKRVLFREFDAYFAPLDGKHGIHAKFHREHYNKPTGPQNAIGRTVLSPVAPENQMQDDYYRYLATSIFAGSPRGDNLYSVRFSEILSSGAIPVIYADGYVLPYNLDVVNWSELAVMLPQRRVQDTLAVLVAIPNATRCAMQKKALAFFQDFVANSAGRLRAILQLLDAPMLRNSHDNKSSIFMVPFSAAPE
jgi:Exostosin family